MNSYNKCCLDWLIHCNQSHILFSSLCSTPKRYPNWPLLFLFSRSMRIIQCWSFLGFVWWFYCLPRVWQSSRLFPILKKLPLIRMTPISPTTRHFRHSRPCPLFYYFLFRGHFSINSYYFGFTKPSALPTPLASRPNYWRLLIRG